MTIQSALRAAYALDFREYALPTHPCWIAQAENIRMQAGRGIVVVDMNAEWDSAYALKFPKHS